MFKPDNIENEFFLKLGFSFSPDELKKGKVLISEPFLGDPNFNRTVILLAEYDKEEGAFGFVINRKTELVMGDIVEGFPKEDFPFQYGGPVSAENLFYIHTLGDVIPESKLVKEGLYWGGEFEAISSQISMGKVTAEEVRFFGGYSGWTAGQLEGELKDRSWILCDLEIPQIMMADGDEMWRRSLKSLGKKFSIMAEFPEDPGLN